MIDRLRSIRPLDAAVIGVAVAVLVLGGFLGWSVYSQSKSVKKAAPISRAITELVGRVKRSPDNLDLRMELAQAYTVAGRDDDATEQYKQILKVKKDYIPALSGLGFVASRQRDWEQSEEYWRKVLGLLNKTDAGKIGKQYETACFYLGTALLEQKKYEESVGYLKESLRINRSASDTHYLLAAAYRGMGADDQYKVELEYTLAFDPSMAEANYDYGKLLLAEGDVAGAAQYFRISADRAPSRPEPKDALDQLGPFESRMSKAKALAKDKPEDALIEARVAVALEPKNIEGLLLLASLYEKTGDRDLAVGTYRNILTVDAKNGAATAALERLSNDK